MSTPAAFPPGTSRPPDPADREERVAIRRALGLGLIIWPSFFALDVYMALVVVPGAPLLLFFAYRLGFELLLLVLWWRSRRPEAGGRELRASLRIMAFGAGLIISLLGIPLGGLSSPYVHGLAIVVLVMSVTIPSPWSVSLTWLVPTVLTFPLVMIAASAFDPGIAFSLRDGPMLAAFSAHYVFVLASAAIGSASGHLVWLARRQLYEARRLGRYRLKAPLGRGSMNEVWLAWDETLRRDVALKILRASAEQERSALERFLREAQTLSRLASPHTVRVYDFGGSDDGVYFIAMERLVGADLQRVVRRHGPLPPARVLHIARQACRSLMEAHAEGVVHRDLKPANLFLTRAGAEHDFVKVVDFGLARAPDLGPRLTQSVILGTPHYIAPELWLGGEAGARSDLYALGGTLHTLLAGREPFKAVADPVAMARAHLAVPPGPLPATVPAPLAGIVGRCLRKRPEERYASANEMLADLESLREALPWSPDEARRAFQDSIVESEVWVAGSEADDALASTIRVDREPVGPAP